MKEEPLTPYQRTVLARFQAGEIMHRCVHTCGFRVTYFFHSKIGEGFRGSAVHALEKRGLIEDIEDPGWLWRGSRYRITEKGKACQI